MTFPAEVAATDQETTEARVEASALATFYLMLRLSGMPAAVCEKLTMRYADFRFVVEAEE